MNIPGPAFPILGALILLATIVLALRVRIPPGWQFARWKAITLCIIHLVIAGGVLRFLNSGGWLTAHYSWDDSDNVNGVAALTEALIILAVLAFAITRRPRLYKWLIALLICQALIVLGYCGLFLWFVLTYKPRMF